MNVYERPSSAALRWPSMTLLNSIFPTIAMLPESDCELSISCFETMAAKLSNSTSPQSFSAHQGGRNAAGHLGIRGGSLSAMIAVSRRLRI
jgi:hypothetical protein